MRKNCLDYEKWFEDADGDLNLAKMGIDSGQEDVARSAGICCFNAVEKALKAVIINRSKKLPEMIHDLGNLFNKLPDEIKQDLSKEEIKFISEMTQYFVPLRYPQENRIDFTMETVAKWHKLSAAIVSKLKSRC